MAWRDSAAGLVRRALAARGLELRRAGQGPRRTLAEVLAAAGRAGLQAASVIDVGVARGTPGLHDVWPEARLLLVEPVAEWEPQLRSLTTGRGRCVIAASGREPRTTEIRVHRVPELSSVLGERDEGLTQARTVPVVRLDDEARDLDGPIVIKVDVEGGELDVLEGARATLERTELVALEASLFELVPGQPLLHDVVAFMADAGLVPYDVFGGHLRPLDGALAQIDVAFVREDGPLRAHSAYATPEQAERLYSSWGL